MRATDLNFRSPKEKTPEFIIPEVTFDGRFLPLVQKNQNSTFSKSKRFNQYNVYAKVTGPNTGPGSYNLSSPSRVAGTPSYHPLHGNRDTSDNGYYFLGNSLVYEPSLAFKFKKPSNLQKKTDTAETNYRSTSVNEDLVAEDKPRGKTSLGARHILRFSPYKEKLYHKRIKSVLKPSH